MGRIVNIGSVALIVNSLSTAGTYIGGFSFCKPYITRNDQALKPIQIEDRGRSCGVLGCRSRDVLRVLRVLRDNEFVTSRGG